MSGDRTEARTGPGSGEGFGLSPRLGAALALAALVLGGLGLSASDSLGAVIAAAWHASGALGGGL